MKQDHDHLLAICLPVNTTSMPMSPRDQRRHDGLCCVARELVFCHVVKGVVAAGHHDDVGGDLDGAMATSMANVERSLF